MSFADASQDSCFLNGISICELRSFIHRQNLRCPIRRFCMALSALFQIELLTVVKHVRHRSRESDAGRR